MFFSTCSKKLSTSNSNYNELFVGQWVWSSIDEEKEGSTSLIDTFTVHQDNTFSFSNVSKMVNYNDTKSERSDYTGNWRISKDTLFILWNSNNKEELAWKIIKLDKDSFCFQLSFEDIPNNYIYRTKRIR